MGFVERYGLVALFVLCALIVGVGVFADDGALSEAKAADKKLRQVVKRQESLATAGSLSPKRRWELSEQEGLQNSGLSNSGGEAGQKPRLIPSDDEMPISRRRREEESSRLSPEPFHPVSPDASRGDVGGGEDALGDRFNPKGLLTNHNRRLGSEPERRAVRLGGAVKVNPLPGPKELPPVLPMKRVQKQAEKYLAQRGDGLWRIAEKMYGVKNITATMRAIQALNPDIALAENHSGKKLQPGMVVLLPKEGLRKSLSSSKEAGAKGVSSKKSSTGGIQSTKGATEHVVAKGESLWKISERYYGAGKHWKRLARHNGIDPEKNLVLGTKLKIPAKLK